MNWTTPEMVLKRWVSDGAPQADSDTFTTLIDDAEDCILKVYPNIQERIDNGSMPIKRVQRVVSQVVIRYYKLMNEVRSYYSETTGPFSQAGNIDAGLPKGMSLTQDEIDSLSKTDNSSKAFSFSTWGGGCRVPKYWHTIDVTGDYFD